MFRDNYPDRPLRFRQLNEGQPHTIARRDINAKLIKMAQVERGLATVQRAPVPDEQVDWYVDYPEYEPPFIDIPRGKSSFRKKGDKADPADPREIAEFSSLETSVVQRDQYGRPLNPMGRTGISGRGMLDKWGATSAADPLLTRHNPETGALEILLIQRGDTGEWGLPGGKVDEGEEPWQAAGRELREEARVRGVRIDFSSAERTKVIYAGYADDSRNTDNAWMETTVLHYHLNEEEARNITIEASSDAVDARWFTVNEDFYTNPELFSSHGQYIRAAVGGG